MLEIIALISVASWFARTAKNHGLSPVAWVIAGLASYFGAELGVMFAIRDHVAAWVMADATDVTGALIARVGTVALGVAAGIAACAIVASLLERRAAKVQQESVQ